MSKMDNALAERGNIYEQCSTARARVIGSRPNRQISYGWATNHTVAHAVMERTNSRGLQTAMSKVRRRRRSASHRSGPSRRPALYRQCGSSPRPRARIACAESWQPDIPHFFRPRGPRRPRHRGRRGGCRRSTAPIGSFSRATMHPQRHGHHTSQNQRTPAPSTLSMHSRSLGSGRAQASRRVERTLEMWITACYAVKRAATSFTRTDCGCQSTYSTVLWLTA